ncbi:hypothetical protein J2T55_000999 [Methylohalomonas lacus]|uniref:Uncharacterized protein n=1 Tax=Methylohalomonas lacus TaxID=398773 RepID=A0AAE3HII9_9GAMM|nr:hypothetical protein [Methylohalomonas lacus]MCS3902991.1 hypothetical protein [Methylohalomonas lacus]
MDVLRALLMSVVVASSPLALSDEPATSKQDGNDRAGVPSGTLLMPGQDSASGRQTQSESRRKCMRVCREWGEDCIIDSKQGTRKCRRSCKQFGMECF